MEEEKVVREVNEGCHVLDFGGQGDTGMSFDDRNWCQNGSFVGEWRKDTGGKKEEVEGMKRKDRREVG